MSPVNQTERLNHIIEAITRIETFCNQIWNTIIKDLPELKGIIGKIRDNE